MDFYLLWIGISVVFIGYFIVFIDYLTYKNKFYDDINGFDMAKSITDDYDAINIVVVNGISRYQIRRKLVRLSKKVYYGHDAFSLMISSFLASLSYFKFFRSIKRNFSFFGFMSHSSLVMIIISFIFYSKGDIKIGIFIGVVIAFYQYFYLNIIANSNDIFLEKMKSFGDIINIYRHLYKVHVLFFVSSLVFILRFIVMLIG